MSYLQDIMRDRHRKETIRTVAATCQVLLTLLVLALTLYGLVTR